MNGDLGNLLTGELGEAEARFAHDDFAGDYGRHVVGRVRRRRTVRAVGVGGGTMLTAGALAIGATQVPWGTLGVAGLGDVGGTDCATPSAPPAPSLSTILFVSDPTTGALRMMLSQDEDGILTVTFGSGEPQVVALDAQGKATFNTPEGTTLTVDVTGSDGDRIVTMTEGDSTSYTYQVEVQGTGKVELSPEASPTAPSDDCYTPSSTPSGDPSATATPSPSPDQGLAAKPEDVIGDSPFECGFTFPAESLKTDALWIDGAQWMTGADAAAAIQASFADDPSQAPGIGNPTALVAVVTVHFAGAETEGGSIGHFGTAEPSTGQIDTTRFIDTSRPTDATHPYASEGATYVGVSDGRVVATGAVPTGDGRMLPPVYLEPGAFPENGALLYLLDQGAALTPCDANLAASTPMDLFVVAGLIVKHADGTVDGPTYAWLPIGEP